MYPSKVASFNSYMRDMAGLPEGKNFMDQPFTSMFRTATTPFFSPFIRKKHPKTEKYLRYGLGGIGVGALAGTAVFGPQMFGNIMGRKVNDAILQNADGVGLKIRPEEAEQFSRNLSKNLPKIVENVVRNDDSLLTKNIYEKVILPSILPELRDQAYKYTDDGLAWIPTNSRYNVSRTLDILKATTPIGLVTSALPQIIAKQNDLDYPKIVKDTGKDYIGQVVAGERYDDAENSILLKEVAKQMPSVYREFNDPDRTIQHNVVASIIDGIAGREGVGKRWLVDTLGDVRNYFTPKLISALTPQVPTKQTVAESAVDTAETLPLIGPLVGLANKKSSDSTGKRKVVIIKGNPNRAKPGTYGGIYEDLHDKLVQSGFDVTFDDGEPFTTPPPAYAWIGHSRGAGRLRFAKDMGVNITIPIGSKLGDINHPDDIVDIVPDAYDKLDDKNKLAHNTLHPTQWEKINNRLKNNNELINKLKLVKQLSDAGLYEQKAQLLRDLIKKEPKKWKIDSEQDYTVGLTGPVNWRYHLPKKELPIELLKLLNNKSI